jgi:hypothetical protein
MGVDVHCYIEMIIISIPSLIAQILTAATWAMRSLTHRIIMVVIV